MRESLWKADAKRSELQTIASLEIQIKAAETKAKPYTWSA
jgi:hypothetical protein